MGTLSKQQAALEAEVRALRALCAAQAPSTVHARIPGGPAEVQP